jgi:hypothetical protein
MRKLLNARGVGEVEERGGRVGKEGKGEAMSGECRASAEVVTLVPNWPRRPVGAEGAITLRTWHIGKGTRLNGTVVHARVKPEQSITEVRREGNGRSEEGRKPKGRIIGPIRGEDARGGVGKPVNKGGTEAITVGLEHSVRGTGGKFIRGVKVRKCGSGTRGEGQVRSCAGSPRERGTGRRRRKVPLVPHKPP